jgi:ribosome biogenesis GTPase
MTKKLSRQQENRIITNKRKTLEQFDIEPGALKKGIVICRYGSQADIEDDDRKVHRCTIRRTVSSLVSGDEVLWFEDQGSYENNGIVEAVLDRRSELLRPDFYDGLKPVAANIDCVAVVASIIPELSTNIIDRYLISCHHAQITPLIVINKIDMLDTEEQNRLKKRLNFYCDLGYEIFYTSTKTKSGIDELKNRISSSSIILAGQSGVGKSSLLNALMENDMAATCSISENSGLGQHTTTCTRLFHFGEKGIILDSPGVRELGLWHLTPDYIIRGYREFIPYIGTCKYKDCQHLSEAGCSIRQAVQEGKINRERYDNYTQIRATLDLLERKNKTRRANTDRNKNYSTKNKKRKEVPLP